MFPATAAVARAGLHSPPRSARLPATVSSPVRVPMSPTRISSVPRTPRTPQSQLYAPRTPRSPSCRFLGDRDSLHLDRAHDRLTEALKKGAEPAVPEGAQGIDGKTGVQSAMRELLFDGEVADKVLGITPSRQKNAANSVWNSTVFGAGGGGSSDLLVASGLGTRRREEPRSVQTTADKILDAPELRADFYLNVIDWSQNNVIAVALDNIIYLWSASTGSIKQLLELSRGLYVSSVKFCGDESSNVLSVGISNGAIELWDTDSLTKLQTLPGHDARVATLAWCKHRLASGDREGSLIITDVGSGGADVIVRRKAHTHEVCGLQWSPDHKFLASGGNDNVVQVWGSDIVAVRRFEQHTAAVKALAWCSTRPELLATGGGTMDRCIRIFNVITGVCLSCVDTNAQVSALVWHPLLKELISAHGYTDNQLILWKAPSLERITALKGHTERILNMVLSPDLTTVVSAAGDETLRFWKCFSGCEKLRKKQSANSPSRLTLSIR